MAKLEVRWTKIAIDNLNNAYESISADRENSAKKIIAKIEGGVDQLCRFPESGRLGRVQGTRELVVVTTPFIIIYRLKNSSIEILSILHASRKWPDD